MNGVPQILIVEDEALVRRIVARHLRRKGFDAHEAGSLADAGALLERLRFDVLILDRMLPDGDGLDLLHGDLAARTLVISANPQPLRLRAAGVSDYLTKPFDLDALSARVAALAGVPGSNGAPAPERRSRQANHTAQAPASQGIQLPSLTYKV